MLKPGIYCEIFVLSLDFRYFYDMVDLQQIKNNII